MNVKWLAVLVLVAITESHCDAATHFWLSATDSISTGSPLGEVPVISHATGDGEQSIHLWARPDAGATLANFSLNLRSDRSGVISFATASDGVQIHDPVLAGSSIPRFEFLRDADDCSSIETEPCIEATADMVSDFQAFTLGGPSAGQGIGPATASSAIDPLYSSEADAWLLATVKYNVVGAGTTKFFLQIGENGILNQGADPNDPADQDVVLGSDSSFPLSSEDNRDCDLTCDPLNKPQHADALISVAAVPFSEWTGTSAGDWSDSTRWTGPGGAPPTIADDVLIDVAGTQVVVSDSQAGYTTMVSDGELYLDTNGRLTSLLVVNSDAVVAGEGIIDGLVINESGTLSPGGTTSISPITVASSSVEQFQDAFAIAEVPEPWSARLAFVAAGFLAATIRGNGVRSKGRRRTTEHPRELARACVDALDAVCD